ncbi:DNA-binding response regulator [Clostridium baratii]|uniref:Stage 0 sporulation protein A homolog n=1 Tax=Clostridium baratii TaxID=1561 RepID=A0A174SUV6_9CLOT|nr:response regulator transcription factor [Clostridium baratii]OPF50584.1 DNA-binding response regulator [Clostridium baratii]OPF54171.1 DNA-binding response regulator [Clostridium baratii]OPF58735.1 DNA-binding response regulator [Clostridium baratii]OPF58893.1 DNA-binding response regulator [Clostridium baratii]CUP99677.1 transcriptional regulatory protein [Clostridium baratii]
MNKNNILVVDDEVEIVDAIEIYLKNEETNIIKAYDGEEALKKLKENEIHLIIMDIMMPKLDGLKATMKIREEKNIPIIILSAKSQGHDKVLGLTMGADDYITKPFDPLELIARSKSQLRRYKTLGSYKVEEIIKENKIEIGRVTLNKDSKELILDNTSRVKLTLTEYKILDLLMSNKGRVFSSEQIYRNVWGEDAINTDTIMVHIRRIREKIEINPKKPEYLKVVWGIGYKFEKV